MESKLQHYTELAERQMVQITRSRRQWIGFLDTAARLYKYPFPEQLMIYAQRPDATACAPIELWNQKMQRYVRRGSRGIALIDDAGDRARLRYVFDVADTEPARRGAPNPYLWEMREEHERPVAQVLAERYGVTGAELPDMLHRVSRQLAADYCAEYEYDIQRAVEGSFLDKLDAYNVHVAFRDAVGVSMSYILLTRCGLEPSETIMDEDFQPVFDFNTPDAVIALGSAVSELSEQVLREIEITVKNQERRMAVERSAEYGRVELQPDRRLSAAQPGRGGNDADSGDGQHRALRADAQAFSETAPSNVVSFPAAARRAVPTSERDRSGGQFADDAGDEDVDRPEPTSAEGTGSVGLGDAYEQPARPSGGDDPERVDLQLDDNIDDKTHIGDSTITPAQELSGAGVTLSSTISQEGIDAALAYGSAVAGGKLRIYAYFQEQHTPTERAAFLKNEYGTGGRTHALPGEGSSAEEHDSKGITLTRGPYTNPLAKVHLSWARVAQRIDALIREGRYLSPEEHVLVPEPERVMIVPMNEQLSLFGNGLLLPSVDDQQAAIVHETDAGLEEDFLFTDEEIARVKERLERPTPEDVARLNDMLDMARRADDRSRERTTDEERQKSEYAVDSIPAVNHHITDDHLGEGGAKTKYGNNIAAIRALKLIEAEQRQATPDEQEILSRYVGWGGVPQAFDAENASWSGEYTELRELLTPDEYALARGSTLNAHYTSPVVIRAIYDAIARMGFTGGNILEPACGIGNFFGLLPESMQNSKLYGVELDSVTGRIAAQLYPQAQITVAGFEKTALPGSFFDLAVGNVPFGSYQLADRRYDRHHFLIHDYFFAKTLDLVRPGGVVAFITSKGTLDKQNPDVRRYIAQRAELLGAVRLPNDAFLKNAGTEVTTDILFLKKRDRVIDLQPEDESWVHLGFSPDGISMNGYFAEHPEMMLGTMAFDSSMYGNNKETTCNPIPGADLSRQLRDALLNIQGRFEPQSLDDIEGADDHTIPSDPGVRNFSYALVDGQVYFRENARMAPVSLPEATLARVRGMVALRDCAHELIRYQLEDYTDTDIAAKQAELNDLYDTFTVQHGLINSPANARAFSSDSAYYLLCSLEILDENGSLARKADMFTRRTIRQRSAVTSVDTAAEALAVSIAERACVDLPFMANLMGGEYHIPGIVRELEGVIFKDPVTGSFDSERPDTTGWYTADEYLSGNVREKLRIARAATEAFPFFAPNVAALERAQPKDLDASEVAVRLGSTWIDKGYIEQFTHQLLKLPFYMERVVQVNYAEYTAEWNITGKNSVSYNNVLANVTYGTERVNALHIIEETLNLRDVRVYDTVTEDGKEKRVLNKKQTALAQQKQEAIKTAFKDWIWQDADRRRELVTLYNERFNSVRPREYDGSHINFSGMSPDIALRPHQLNAIAHVLYGGNTLLAHEVGAGKTFEMVAAAMESKRLGLCHKSLFAVPNHLTEQWASEFLRLYPSANLLVATKKDFEARNRKKFCARIATGDYDAVIIGHSQLEKIPISVERQERLIQEQIDEISAGIDEMRDADGARFTVKQLEKTRKSLEARLEKLNDVQRDDVVTFEQLGVDRLFVDEAHMYKNLFLYTKMRNVAGIPQTEAQKSSDLFMKCRYLDEVTGNKGTVFATGTPISNSMTEMYTMQRYLQYDLLQSQRLTHFDAWASTFGETVTAIELAPEGTGYRARTRFAKFHNLPELMCLFKQVADIKTADTLNLPRPVAHYQTVVASPTELQRAMVADLSKRATAVQRGVVDPSEDNMLKITSDGRKIGLDQRLMNPLLPDDPASKVNTCVESVLNIWRDTAPEKLTQLVFCDFSTPNADRRFNVYDDMKAKLVDRGVPENEIAFIHDADTEARKKELFVKVRQGQVRVLMGSTFKMGSGTNVQDRLIALHDLDCPWRPSDLEQRAGRIVRQGNLNPEVSIYRYVTEATFDAYLYQTVENKQKFISQIMTSKSPVRACEDVDEVSLSYAEIKALCAGDERIKEKMQLDIDVAQLRLLKADHQSQYYKLEDNLLKVFPLQIGVTQTRIEKIGQDIQRLESHPVPKDGFTGMEIHGVNHAEKDAAGKALLAACQSVRSTDAIAVGSYRGFDLSLAFDAAKQNIALIIRGEMSYKIELGNDPHGNITRINNALDGLARHLTDAQDQLASLHQQQTDARAELQNPFPQEGILAEKSERLAALDAALNMGGGRDEEIENLEPSIASEPDVLSIKPSVLASLRDGCNRSGDAGRPERSVEVQPTR